MSLYRVHAGNMQGPDVFASVLSVGLDKAEHMLITDDYSYKCPVTFALSLQGIILSFAVIDGSNVRKDNCVFQLNSCAFMNLQDNCRHC